MLIIYRVFCNYNIWNLDERFDKQGRFWQGRCKNSITLHQKCRSTFRSGRKRRGCRDRNSSPILQHADRPGPRGPPLGRLWKLAGEWRNPTAESYRFRLSTSFGASSTFSNHPWLDCGHKCRNAASCEWVITRYAFSFPFPFRVRTWKPKTPERFRNRSRFAESIRFFISSEISSVSLWFFFFKIIARFAFFCLEETQANSASANKIGNGYRFLAFFFYLEEYLFILIFSALSSTHPSSSQEKLLSSSYRRPCQTGNILHNKTPKNYSHFRYEFAKKCLITEKDEGDKKIK